MGIDNQAVTPGRTTLVDAVNVLLLNIGEAPVNTLSNEQVGESRVALQTIREYHREGQLRGWCWNSEDDYPFQKDTLTGEIVVPENIVRWTPNIYLYQRRFSLRGQKVYDNERRSTVMEPAMGEIQASIVSLLSWEESPEPYNRWTTVRAARVFAARVVGNDATVKYTMKDEMDAMAELQRMELENSEYNILTGGRGLAPFPTFQPGYGLLRNVAGGRAIG